MQATLKDFVGTGFAKTSPMGAATTPPYLRALGLQRNPFPVVPDATRFYLSSCNETIVAEMLHAIESRKGFMVITGEVGLGKTTLSRRMLMMLEKRGIRTALVFNTFHQGAELLHEINKDFGVDVKSHDLGSQMSALNDFLLKNLALGINCAIIIDDAQQLSIESLELVRQVSNLETDNEKLVQILLVGQPELDVKLDAHELRQLKSRIVLQHLVSPYTLPETTRYVLFKLMHAGGHGRLQITAPAFRLLQRLTGGNPRKINILMDRCLYAVIAYGTYEINQRLMADAAREVRPTSTRKPTSRSNLPAKSAVLLFLVPLLVVGLSSSDKVRIGAVETSSLTPNVSDNPTPANPDSLMSASGDSSLAPFYPRLSLRQDKVSEVESFLSAYKLEQYSTRFMQALTTGETGEITEKIALSSGFKLVRLGALPDGVEHYPVLKVAGTSAKDDEYLLFWRPIAYFYRDIEVQELQRSLRSLGHYSGTIDGLVGPLTSIAIRRFQNSLNLPPSGTADNATLFLLQHFSAGARPSNVAGVVSTAIPQARHD